MLLAFVSIQVGVLKDYQLARLTGFIDPSADPKGTGYNVRQATIAIGSGGVHGQGLFQGAQTQGKFVPAQQTDFIFTVAGEELGFVGAAGIVLLLGIVLWRAGRIAMGAEDLFGRLVATGVLVLVRLPGVREHRHDAGDHAGHRRTPAVRVLRRFVDVRQPAGGRAAAERPHAPLRLTPGARK